MQLDLFAPPPLRRPDTRPQTRKRPWRVLVACERSGIVRNAFLALGCNAWSCDLAPQEGTGPHLTEDVLARLTRCPDVHAPWDLLIAHPPCTYLCSSGMHWTTRGLRDPQLTLDAIAFAEALWFAPVAHIAIENPVGALSTRSRLGKPAQIIQPHQFGHDASKATCLWLKNLPPLTPTQQVAPRLVTNAAGKTLQRWSNQTDSGQNKLPPSENRWMERSRTYPGIAQAMAEQWISHLNGELERNL